MTSASLGAAHDGWFVLAVASVHEDGGVEEQVGPAGEDAHLVGARCGAANWSEVAQKVLAAPGYGR